MATAATSTPSTSSAADEAAEAAVVERGRGAVAFWSDSFPTHGVLRDLVRLPHLWLRVEHAGEVGTAGRVWPAARLAALYIAEQLAPAVAARAAEEKTAAAAAAAAASTTMTTTTRRGQPLAGVRALELGCGTGAVGLSAALLGAEVVLTDLPECLQMARLGARRTFVEAAAAVAAAAAGGGGDGDGDGGDESSEAVALQGSVAVAPLAWGDVAAARTAVSTWFSGSSDEGGEGRRAGIDDVWRSLDSGAVVYRGRPVDDDDDDDDGDEAGEADGNGCHDDDDDEEDDDCVPARAGPDLILGSDLVWEPGHVDLLVPTIEALLDAAPRGCELLLAYKERVQLFLFAALRARPRLRVDPLPDYDHLLAGPLLADRSEPLSLWRVAIAPDTASPPHRSPLLPQVAVEVSTAAREQQRAAGATATGISAAGLAEDLGFLALADSSDEEKELAFA